MEQVLTEQDLKDLARIQSKLTNAAETRWKNLCNVPSGDYLYSKEIDQLSYLSQQVKQSSLYALELASFLAVVPEKDYDGDRRKHSVAQNKYEDNLVQQFNSFLEI